MSVDYDPEDPPLEHDGEERTGRPPRLSVSAADTYEQCPAKWKAKYLDRVPEEAGPEAIIGTLTHTILEHITLEPPERRTLRRAATIAQAEWPEDLPPELRARAMTFTAAALRLPTAKTPSIGASERRIEVELGGVPFVGVIDLTEYLPSGAAVVTDWKTGKRPNRADWMAPKRRQVLLYAAAVEAEDGRPVAEARIVWIPIRYTDRISTERSALTEAVDWLGNVSTAIDQDCETETFEAKPGPLCSWCPAVADCPSGFLAVKRRSKDPTKSLGDYGRAALAAEKGDG